MRTSERWVWENPEILKSIDRGMGFDDLMAEGYLAMGKKMICDDCVKKDVCPYGEEARVAEEGLDPGHFSLTCKHKHVCNVATGWPMYTYRDAGKAAESFTVTTPPSMTCTGCDYTPHLH